MLLDSNIIIYASKAPYVKLRQWLDTRTYLISALSGQEVMSSSLTAYEKKIIDKLFSRGRVIAVNDTLLESAHTLRQDFCLSAADAVIAATAMALKVGLCSANHKDFKRIKALELIILDDALLKPAHINGPTT